MNSFEITVKIDLELNNLLNYLNKNRFKFHQSFRCIDTFLIKNEDFSNELSYEDFNKCLILRELIFKDKTLRLLLRKIKTYDSSGNIIESQEESTSIDDVKKIKTEYLENGYKELIKMDDYCYTFSKNMHEFIVEHINSLGTFIEFENRNFDSIISNGNSIEELISLFDTFNIPYIKDDYFCKKAWLLYKKEYLNEE